MSDTGRTESARLARGAGGLRSPLFRRLFPATVTLACLPLLATAIAALAMGRKTAGEEAATRLRSDALLMREAFRDALARRDAASADALAKSLGRAVDATRFTVMDGDGAVLGDSDHDPATMDNHASRPEIVQARELGVGQARRFSDTLRQEMFYVAVRADDARPAAGFVRAALPQSALEGRFRALLLQIALAAAPLGLVATVALALALLAVVRALGEVTRGARRVASGRPLEPMEAATRRDEIGDLARSVRDMAEELERRIVTIGHERNELATIVSGMGEGLIAVDARGSVLLSNDVAATLLGIAAPLPVGKDLVDAIPHGQVVAAVREALRGGKTVACTVEVFLAPPREIEVRATPLADRGGAVVLLRDVTEAARYERLRRDFVANVSHELRTPLSLVKGFLETLEDGALHDAEKAPGFLRIASRHVVALEALVEDLLTLGKLDAHAETRPPSPVSLAEVCDGVLAGFQEVFARKRLALRRSIVPDLPPALGHWDLIERAIRNLVDNAVKFTDQGEVAVAIARDGDRLVVQVSDTGPGIPREDLARIFERFYRVEKSRSREAGGTGLGLAIVKHIAQQEGGSVSVESELGKGSVFRLALAVAETGKAAP
ncbi:PAS domain-containing protein [bacterium]|nr:PAS domain-containing protein [bacterium]